MRPEPRSAGAVALAVVLQMLLAPAPRADARSVPAEVVKLGGNVVLDDRGGAEVRARLEIAPGFHINAHRPDADFLIPTVLTLSAAGAEFEAPRYPEPIARSFAFSEGKKVLVYDGAIEILARSPSAPTGPVKAQLRYQACDEERCLPPKTVAIDLPSPERGAWAPGEPAGAGATALLGSPPPEAPGPGQKQPWLVRWLEGASLPAALAMTLVLGLTLNLTPCVYPLISVTIAYFGGQARTGTRPWPLAIAYVAGISASFAALGVSASVFGGLIGAPLQHPAVLIGLALLLVGLAASSFGLFEIRAPAALLSRYGHASGGIGGAALMGLTMGIVAAPCIGPVILGLLVYVGAQRDVLLGFSLFLAMGLGMGLPYVALASAAGSLGRLPRSGEWLRWMNRLFGVLLLGMALYFVSPLLDPAALRVAVPILVGLAGLYLGFLEPSGRGLRGFTVARRIAGASALVFAAWLVVWSADAPAGEARGRIRWAPLSIAALDQAIESRRPAIVEFAADWCLPCAVMEQTTFSDPEVAREAARFSALQADVTESTPETDLLLARFQILGVPTIILYDTDGVEVDRVVGYVDASRFASMMRQIAGTPDPPMAAEAESAVGASAAPDGSAS
jgi:thioredoxin:protein disulfide reductase